MKMKIAKFILSISEGPLAMTVFYNMKKALSLFIFVLFLAACTRVPTAKRADHLLTHFFNKYGKKYPASDFSSKVSHIEIESINELQKNLAAIGANVQLENGNTIPVEVTVLRKAPFGWRINGWEQSPGPR